MGCSSIVLKASYVTGPCLFSGFNDVQDVTNLGFAPDPLVRPMILPDNKKHVGQACLFKILNWQINARLDFPLDQDATIAQHLFEEYIQCVRRNFFRDHYRKLLAKSISL